MTYVRYPDGAFPAPPDHVESYGSPDKCQGGLRVPNGPLWTCTLPAHDGTHEAACYLDTPGSYVVATWEDDDPGAVRE